MTLRELTPDEHGLSGSPASISTDALDNASEKLAIAQAEGIALLVPGSVDVTTQDAVPLLGIVAGFDVLSLRFSDKAVLLATDLDRRITYVGRWAAWRDGAGKRKRPPPPVEADPDDDGEAPREHTVYRARADLYARLPRLPWMPSTLAVQLLLQDWQSRPSPLRLTGSPFLDDPAVVEFLKDHAVDADAVGVDEAPGMWLDSAPAGTSLAPLDPPPSEGLALAVTPVAFASREAAVALSFAFHLPILPHEHRRFQAGGPVDASGRMLGAKVPLTVVVTGESLVDPLALRIMVPVYVLEERTGETVRGKARGMLNLAAFSKMPKSPGKYWVRLVVGAFQTEPAALTLVPENLRVVRPRQEG